MRRPIVLLLAVLLGSAFAQLASGTEPEEVADRAVEAWLASERPDFGTLTTLSTEEACELLPTLLQSPPPAEGTNVNLNQRRELSSDDESVRRFSYPASSPSGVSDVVEVSLENRAGTWEAVQVGYQLDTSLTGVRAWLQTPLASWLFVGFSAYVIFLLLTPSFFRTWLAEGRAVIAEHRRLVVTTILVFYGLFFLGSVTGANLPEACTTSILEIVTTAITSLGATEAYASLNVARAAVVTFYQNFGVVTLSVLFGFGILFGFPAYLFGAFSFYAQGIPFGLIGGVGLGQLLFVLILLFLELTSYFLVISGGGMLLATLVRGGFGSFGLGLRKLALTLPFALILLLVGAWYEAGIIILPQLLGGP